jgi:hypothetical protein
VNDENDGMSAVSKASRKKSNLDDIFALKSRSRGEEIYFLVPHPKCHDSFQNREGVDALLKTCISLLKIQVLASCIQYNNLSYFWPGTIELPSEINDTDETDQLAKKLPQIFLRGWIKT